MAWAIATKDTPFWVIRVVLRACRSLPFYPDKQRCSVSVGMRKAGLTG
jgi:hypothetical protein